MLTVKQFQQAAGLNDALANKWYQPVVSAMAKYGINTPLRMAHFIAQTGHESSGFATVEESLNYKSSALTAKFPKRITPADAERYGRTDSHPADQRMIGSIIYANRNGNGDVKSGDGYKYRGRGLIQITGRGNYSALVNQLRVDIVNNPEKLTEPNLAAESAAAWWKNNGLNEVADSDDVDRITRIINGGTNGMEDRKSRLLKAKGILCST